MKTGFKLFLVVLVGIILWGCDKNPVSPNHKFEKYPRDVPFAIHIAYINSEAFPDSTLRIYDVETNELLHSQKSGGNVKAVLLTTGAIYIPYIDAQDKTVRYYSAKVIYRATYTVYFDDSLNRLYFSLVSGYPKATITDSLQALIDSRGDYE